MIDPAERNGGGPDSLVNKLLRFMPLSDEDRHVLGELAEGRLRHVRAHDDIIHEGQAPTHVNLVVAGWAYTYKFLPDGRRQILGFLFPGDFCGPRVFLLKRLSYSVGTFAPTTIAEIPSRIMVELTSGWSPIAQAIWWSSLVLEAIDREWIVNLGQRTAVERLGHLLCEVIARLRVVGLAQDFTCAFPLTQTDLADACGLSVVHINRSLQDLRARGLIDLRQRRLVILDFERLAAVAQFTPDYLHLQRDEPQRL